VARDHGALPGPFEAWLATARRPPWRCDWSARRPTRALWPGPCGPATTSPAFAGPAWAKGAGSKAAALRLAFKLLKTAEERWRRFNGHVLVADVLASVTFTDGIRDPDEHPTTTENVAA